MQARRYIISGKVQGVYYRKSTKLIADNLKLLGWVRNVEGGRVEAYAVGSHEQLRAFEGFLHQGPVQAEVRQVIIEESEIINYHSFEILE